MKTAEEEHSFEEPLSKAALQLWLKVQEDNSLFCPYCLLVMTEEKDGTIRCIREGCMVKPAYPHYRREE